MPNPVVHFEVVGKNGGQLRDFYGSVFGWKFDVMAEMDYGIIQDASGDGIGGGIGTGEAPASLFYIAVDDPQAYLDKAASNGGKVTMPVMEIPNIVTLAQFADPEGNVIGLVKDQPGSQPPPSDAKTGANPVTWFEIVGNSGAGLRDFYSKTFGWKFADPGEMDYAGLENDGGISGGVGTVGPGGPTQATFYVQVYDLQATLNKIEGSGGKTVVPVTEVPGMVWFAQFADPEGSVVGLFKPVEM